MLRKLSLVLLVGLFVAPMAACGNRQGNLLQEPAPIQIAGLDKTEVGKAVMRAVPRRGWVFLDKTGERIRAEYVHAKGHAATIAIDYSGDAILILYEDSVDLDYGTNEAGETTIHRTYNSWVNYKRRDIAQEIGQLRAESL
ncbi:MAG: hypothetical protein AAGA57_09685 [Planctomycetota bacterium]